MSPAEFKTKNDCADEYQQQFTRPDKCFFRKFVATVAPIYTVAMINLKLIKLFFFLPRCSHTWELAPASEHRVEFPQFLSLGQSVGLLGRVISSTQGLYLYTNTEKRTHIHKH
jgi:hypothetical protein